MFTSILNSTPPPRTSITPWIIRGAGLVTAGMGAIALLGWLLEVPSLASLGADLIPMAPSSAVLFILFGFAVSFCAVEPLTRATRILCAAIVASGMMAALVLFVAAARGVLWKAELIGLSLDVSLKGIPIGHMSPVGSALFILAGMSLLASLISTGRVGYAWLALGLVSPLLILCAVLLVAYFLGSPLFYEGTIIPPALTSTLAFTTLGIGLWAHAYRQLWSKDESHKSTLIKRAGIALAAVFCLLVGGIVSLAILHYRSQVRHFRTEAEQQLSSIANLKVEELVQWRKERLDDAAVFFKNPVLTTLVKRYFEKTDDVEVQRQLRVWFSQIQSQYCRVSLHDAQGVERMSVPDVLETDSSDFSRYAVEALRARRIIFRDFYRNKHDQQIYLSILIPILDEQDGTRVLGILDLRIDPKTYLYPFIQRWPTSSQTAETLLVRREDNAVVFLNELRFLKNTDLNVRSSLKRHSQPAVRAVMGYEGIVEGLDYREVPVLAAVRAIPDSPWFLVARKDFSEINAPLSERLRITALLDVVLLLGSGAAVGLIWRQTSAGVYREKLAASEALRHQQQLMLTLMENLPDYIYFKDTAGRFLSVNPSMAKLFGSSDPAQIIGKSDADFFSEEHVRKTMADEQEIIRSGRPVLEMEEKETWAEGTQRWILTSKLPLRDGAGRIIGICGISSDITERKRAEEALRKSEERLNFALQKCHFGAWELDLQDHTSQRTLVHDRIFGYETPLTVWTYEMFLEHVLPEDRPNVDRSFKEATATQSDWNFECRIRRNDGEVRWIWTAGGHERNLEGNSTWMAGIVLDITERKKVEQALLETDLDLTKKNAELEHFLYSASHDLKSPVVTVKTFLGYLKQDMATADSAAIEKDLFYINAAAEKMGRLLDELLEMSRIGRVVSPPVKVTFRTLVDEALEAVAGGIAERDVVVTVGDNDVILYGDRLRLAEIWQNLVDNSCKFMGDQKEPRIEIGVETHGTETLFFVRDNGGGIDPRHQSKVFGLFEKLDPKAVGTGIGLTLVKRIVEIYGGRVWVESAGPGQGANFLFTLPGAIYKPEDEEEKKS